MRRNFLICLRIYTECHLHPRWPRRRVFCGMRHISSVIYPRWNRQPALPSLKRLDENELFPSLISTTTLYCDNQAVLKLATDDNYHARTKHIDIRHPFIHQVVASSTIDIVYCPTADMTADILTKALLRWKVAYYVLGLGLRRTSRGVLDSEGVRGTCIRG